MHSTCRAEPYSVIDHIFTSTINKVTFQFGNILTGIALKGTVIGNIQVQFVNAHTPGICPQTIIGVNQQSGNSVITDGSYIVRRKKMMGTSLFLLIPFHQSTFY